MAAFLLLHSDFSHREFSLEHEVVVFDQSLFVFAIAQVSLEDQIDRLVQANRMETRLDFVVGNECAQPVSCLFLLT